MTKNSLSACSVDASSSARWTDEILYGLPAALQPMQGNIGMNPLDKTVRIPSSCILSISPAVPKSSPPSTPSPRARTQFPITAVRWSAAREVITVFDTSKAAIFMTGIASGFVVRTPLLYFQDKPEEERT